MYSENKGKSKFHSLAQVLGTEISAAIKLILLLLALFLVSIAEAQPPCFATDTATPYGGVMAPTRRPIPLSYLREADVMWSKRIWRTMDLREKLNHPYYYPEAANNGLMSLFDLIKCCVLNGYVTAYDNPVFDDEFKVKMSAEQVSALLIQKEVIEVEDPENPGTFKIDTIVNETGSTDIMAYWIKEDWFFDKQRSVMDVRILGICPLAAKKDPTTGAVIGYKPLFWIYFPQLRPFLAKQMVFLGKNSTLPLTYDDLFLKRMFSSYVHKESNVYDRPINSYSVGTDALLEADRVKEQLSNYESDFWHY
jgi:gliding motility associated protien GldN